MTPFTAALWRYPGKGGWTFVTVPPAAAPSITGPWGRVPCIATVDGHRWPTSVWRSGGETMLPVPAKVLATVRRAVGDEVTVTLAYAVGAS